MTINEFNFASKKAIVRVDFNVPLDENGKITDDTRIRGALPTLKKILGDGGSLILMSHMGKPKGKVNPKLSLGQIREDVEKALGVPVSFAPDCAKAAEQAAKEWVIDNKVGVDLVIETRMKEKNSLYAKVNYVPSKGTQPCKLLVFGYKVMD